MTQLSGQHQIILGYEFLKEFNPQIDWKMGTYVSPTWRPFKPLYQKELLTQNTYPANKWPEC